MTGSEPLFTAPEGDVTATSLGSHPAVIFPAVWWSHPGVIFPPPWGVTLGSSFHLPGESPWGHLSSSLQAGGLPRLWMPLALTDSLTVRLCMLVLLLALHVQRLCKADQVCMLNESEFRSRECCLGQMKDKNKVFLGVRTVPVAVTAQHSQGSWNNLAQTH